MSDLVERLRVDAKALRRYAYEEGNLDPEQDHATADLLDKAASRLGALEKANSALEPMVRDMRTALEDARRNATMVERARCAKIANKSALMGASFFNGRDVAEAIAAAILEGEEAA